MVLWFQKRKLELVAIFLGVVMFTSSFMHLRNFMGGVYQEPSTDQNAKTVQKLVSGPTTESNAAQGEVATESKPTQGEVATESKPTQGEVATESKATQEARYCSLDAKLMEEPMTEAYEKRHKKIDLKGVQYAVYKWDGKIKRSEFERSRSYKKGCRVAFKIYNSVLYVMNSGVCWDHIERWEHMDHRYKRVIEPVLMAIYMYDIPNMDFLVELGDELECGEAAFGYSLIKDCEDGKAGFTIPSYGAYGGAMGRSQMDFLFDCLNEDYPFEERILKGVWRGSTTGASMDDDYMANKRANLVLLGHNHSDILDVQMTQFVQMKKATKEALKDLFPLAPSMKMEHYNKYAMIIDMDGNAWSDRFAKLLTYNTPIFKQKSSFLEFFGHLLEPGVHYELFENDLEGLVPRMSELMTEFNTSSSRFRKMALEMHEFAKEHVSQLGVIRAVAYGLNVYASKMTWETKLEDDLYAKVVWNCCSTNSRFPRKFKEYVGPGFFPRKDLKN